MKNGFFMVIFLIFFTDLCDTVSQLLLKLSINSLSLYVNTFKKAFHFILKLIRIPRVWLGFLFSIISFIIWLVVLTKAELGLAFSIDSMRYILIALASMVFLKERINLIRWLGIFCVVLGIILVTIGR